jgi:D-amino-acid oxidase
MKAGINLTTFAINPNIYLPYLQSQLLKLGTTFIRRRLSHIREALSLTNVIPSALVNATGLLSSELGGVEDKNVYPTRGQTILVRNACSKIYARSSVTNDGEGTYVIPRPFGGGTILGGSRQPNNWFTPLKEPLNNRKGLRNRSKFSPSNCSKMHRSCPRVDRG